MLRTSCKRVFALELCCKKCSYTKVPLVWAPRSSQSLYAGFFDKKGVEGPLGERKRRKPKCFLETGGRIRKNGRRKEKRFYTV